MIIVGIDPGKNGCILAMSSDGAVIDRFITPTIGNEIDMHSLYSRLKSFLSMTDSVHAYIEDVHAIFGSSAGNTFQFGKCVGVIQMALVSLCIPFTLVQPKTWQQKMFSGIPEIRKPSTKKNKAGVPIKGARDTKAMALLAAKRLFPSIDLTATERSKKPHDGIIDALLIAEHGRRESVVLVDLV